MPYLRFNPYYGLSAYSTADDGPEFPFREGEIVTMKLVVGSPIAVIEERQTEEDMVGIDAIFEVQLIPKGELDQNMVFVLSPVRRLMGEPNPHVLRFGCDLLDVLQAVITARENVDDFPFKLGQIVTVPLYFFYVRKMSPPSLSTMVTWRSLLSPSGDEVNGLVVANVELAEGC